MRIVFALLMVFLGIGYAHAGLSPNTKAVVVHLHSDGTQTGAEGLYGTPSDGFIADTKKYCSLPTAENRSALAGALLGVFIDWMFDKAMASLSDRFKRRLAKYSETYSNAPGFTRIVHDDLPAGKESAGHECFVFQRFECGDKNCGNRIVGLSIGVLVRKEETHLRVIPYGLDLLRPVAEHAGKKYAVAAHLKMLAPTVDESGGDMWISPEIPVASHACVVTKTREVPADGSCYKSIGVDENAWRSAAVLPLPPKSVQAFVFSVAEVGRPPRGLKGLSEFLDASQGELSDVLSSALKERLKLDEDE